MSKGPFKTLRGLPDADLHKTLVNHKQVLEYLIGRNLSVTARIAWFLFWNVALTVGVIVALVW